ncbi:MULTISPECIES: DUF6172 family protein [Rheinheimera]|jgi:hypothetical protein|uniref:DUF6172 family protein n=1 Tax=Rheinheimera TaxID=67575 RepID=UPI001064D097|nr:MULTISPECIES: DUF6172 family protein [Rheinheimera]|tara:strand:- start:576 stop:890 length:315 start_codon:yes stop_codon:yes gene_type:complete
MKKTIALTHPKHKTERWVELVKHDIKKYLGRERRKALPPGMDYWSFDCRFGATEETAEKVFTSEINKRIDAAAAAQQEAVYVEILARACKHKPRPDAEQDDSAE